MNTIFSLGQFSNVGISMIQFLNIVPVVNLPWERVTQNLKHAFSLLQESRTYLKFDHALANEHLKYITFEINYHPTL